MTKKTEVNKIILPRKDKEGNPYVSYSQINSWNSKKGFNTGLPGFKEYILSYFFNVKFGDPQGWAEFGTRVGTALEHNDFKGFSKKEQETLKKATRLDLFEKEVRITFPGFYLKGFIDSASENLKSILDYKTASENSRKKYYTDEYEQLDIYAMGIKEETGEYPEKMWVEILERVGNPFRGESLSLGTALWVSEREIDEKRLERIKEDILRTTEDISRYYTVFTKLNK